MTGRITLTNQDGDTYTATTEATDLRRALKEIQPQLHARPGDHAWRVTEFIVDPTEGDQE